MKTMCKKKSFPNQSAQTAMELAVFGAILIFMIGAIVRQGMGVSYQQNQRLKAMRWAMSLSFRNSEGLMGGGGEAGNASRNSASILLIEDRLTVDSNKYGAVDRSPYVIMGSGTHSRNLLLPVDAGEDFNLAVFDLIVNGKQFPLTTAGFKKIELARSCANASPCPAECNGDCTPTSPYLSPGADIDSSGWETNCATACPSTTVSRPPGCPACDPVQLPGCPGCPECPAGAPGPPCSAYDPPPATCSDPTLCDSLSPCPPPTAVGCARLYAIVYNHPLEKDWCDHDGAPVQQQCPADCLAGIPPAGFEPRCNLNANGRFDLDRDGNWDVPAAEREKFGWQWKVVMAFNEARKKKDRRPYTILNLAEGINFGKGKNTSLDVDSDLKSESIVIDTIKDNKQGIITRMQVMDLQEGDIDFSIRGNDVKPQFGVSPEATLYTFLKDGTYLQIDEGKLYSGLGDARQYIRTARKKDQVDIILREVQIHKDTNRFCDDGTPGNPTGNVGGVPNPVEVCCGPASCSSGGTSCFTESNVDKTCMYEGDPAAADPEKRYPKIFVRSRISDLRGRKWVTDTSADDYINFVTP